MTAFDWTSILEAQESNRPLLFYTGAGISREAGLRTFRGDDGLWQEYDVSEVATPGAFARDPESVWLFYQKRRKQLRDVEPSGAHEALSRLEAENPNLRVITQNVDDLHERAGQESVVHMHGELRTDRCQQCGRQQPASREEEPPECERCGGRMRPNVVWFGEQLSPEVLDTVNDWIRRTDVVVVVGSSLTVAPASTVPDRARRAGAEVFEVNPNPTPEVSFPEGHRFQGGAGEFFRSLEQRLRE